MREIPILIAGGGPTGLTLGALLASQEIEAVVVEEDASTCVHPQAHAITGRTMEVFRSLGIDREVYAHGLDMRRFGGIRYLTSLAGDELANLQSRFDPKLIAAMMALSPSPPTSTPQDMIEPLLLEALRKNGGEIRFNTELAGFQSDESGVVATIRSNGREEQVRAQWMVACDGASSTIRKALRIPTHGCEPLGHILGLYFHADLSRWSHARPAMLYWTIDAKFPAIFIALDGAERWSLHIPWDPETESLEDYTDERCIAIARHCIGADVPIDMRSILPWTVTSQIADRFREGRVVLAGDAAHRFPPSGGSGLNGGVQDAHNLAWKLAELVRGNAGVALLDTYEQERQPVAEVVAETSVANAVGKGELLMHPPAPFNVIGPERGRQGERLASGAVTIDEMREEIAGAMKSEMTPEKMMRTSDLLYAYLEGAFVADTKVPGIVQGRLPTGRPGERAPHFGLMHKEIPISSLDLFRSGFVVLTVPGEAERWRKAAQTVAVDVEVIGVGSDASDPNGDFPKLYGIEDGAVLVRPDGYVMWSSPRAVADPARALAEIFQQVLGVA